MIKSKKQMFIVISVFALVMMLGTVTYAFFNYTRTGSPNNFSVGRIFFKSDNEETITLSNLFPIDPENTTDMADPTKVGTYSIDITGDTDYVDGLEYLVSIVDSNISNLPISINVSVSNGLGTSSDNYFTARESKNASIYKKLIGDTIVGDGMLLVGYVKPNTTSGVIEGVDGTITITAYPDKNKILISDTYDGTESDDMGTTNAKAEGKTVLTTTEWNALSTNGISFKVRVEANEGIWVHEPTYLYDEVVSKAISNVVINFGENSSDSNGKGVYLLPGTEHSIFPIYYYRGDIDNNNVIFGNYCWQIVRTTDTGGIKMIYNGEVTGNGTTCENTDSTDRAAFTSAYSLDSESMSGIGYMSNSKYNIQIATFDSSSTTKYYGKSVEWDGTNYLLIEDTPNVATTNITLDNYHHYTCASTNGTTCENVLFYYDAYQNGGHYITLSNGDKIEDALYKMTGNGSEETKQRNSGYILNKNDSLIKTNLENWFKNNLTNEINNSKPNYANYLEDTIFCNDRKFIANTGYGWNPNGGSLSTSTNIKYFGADMALYSTTNVPNLSCQNETDRFSVSSSVAHLNYPVGLITTEEVVMAGGRGANLSFYLYTGGNYRGMSPEYFSSSSFVRTTITPGVSIGLPVDQVYDVRPMISLKAKTEYVNGGDGTPTNPYVIE